jgi:hypothetical protein
VLWRGWCKECVLYTREVRGVELWNWKRPTAAISDCSVIFVFDGVELVQYLQERHGGGEVRRNIQLKGV